MSFRPESFDDYHGQTKIKKRLEIVIKACQIRKVPLPHILLVGKPGLGKTSLAYVISREISSTFNQCVGSSLKNDDDIAKILATMDENNQNLLFIDEIHSLPKYTEEKFYQLLEDNEIELTINNETNIYSLPPLTVLGATTRVGALTKPFIDRFGLQFELENYSLVELGYIVAATAARLGLIIDGECAVDIARRARGTPRIAVNLTQRCGDMAIVLGLPQITQEVINETMALYDIDSIGLTPRDYLLLERLAESDKPLGLTTLANTIGEDKLTIETVIEPYLVEQGLITRTNRGRIITDKGIEFVNNKLYE